MSKKPQAKIKCSVPYVRLTEGDKYEYGHVEYEDSTDPLKKREVVYVRKGVCANVAAALEKAGMSTTSAPNTGRCYFETNYKN